MRSVGKLLVTHHQGVSLRLKELPPPVKGKRQTDARLVRTGGTVKTGVGNVGVAVPDIVGLPMTTILGRLIREEQVATRTSRAGQKICRRTRRYAVAPLAIKEREGDPAHRPDE